MREGEAFSLQGAISASPMHGLRPPPVWKRPEVVELHSVRRSGVQKRGLLATFQQRQEQQLADHTLQEAERAFCAKEFEVAFEMFTRVLLQSAVAAQRGVPGAAATHAEAQQGARRARIGIMAQSGSQISPAELEHLDDNDNTLICSTRRDDRASMAGGGCDEDLLLEMADEMADEISAGCNVSFASPPADLPDSPPVITGNSTPGTHQDVDIESVPLKFSNQQQQQQQPSRRRELFAPIPTKDASMICLTESIDKRSTEEENRRRVTVLSTPRTKLALLESLDNLLASLSNSFLCTRCWRTSAGQEVILRHFPNRCDISIDGGLSWRTRKHSVAHFFLTPSQPIVLPLALRPAVQQDQESPQRAPQPQQAAIRIRRSRYGVSNRDYTLAQWKSPGSNISAQGDKLETVILPVLVGAAGHCSASSVSRISPSERLVPQVLSIEIRNFAVLDDRVYGGHYAVYELCTSIALPPTMSDDTLEGFETEVIVQRRFSEFQRVHELVASCYTGTSYTVPVLPPKTWMLRRFDLPFLVDRKRRLQHYLQGLLLLPGVAENADLRAFVMPNHRKQMGNLVRQSLLRDQNQLTDEI